jgi:hypothetical protein
MDSTENRLFEVPAGQLEITGQTIQRVFDLWVEIHRNSRKGRSPVLSPERQRIIRKALESHGEETCLDAIRGCALSDWHMGKNPNGKRYDDIELILRNAQKIENFADMWLEAQSGGGFLD